MRFFILERYINPKSQISTYFYPIENAQSITIGWYIRCGSRNDSIEKRGISYLLERFLYSSAPHYEFEKIGGIFDAITDKDYTRFSLKFHPKYLHNALTCFFDFILKPDWNQEKFNIQKDLQLREIERSDMRYDKMLGSLLWNDHSLSYPVIGTKKTVLKLRLDDLISHKKCYYTQKNVAFFAAGNFDENEIVLMNEFLSNAEFPCGVKESFQAPKIGERKPDIKFLNYADNELEVALYFDLNFNVVNRDCVTLLNSILGEGELSCLSSCCYKSKCMYNAYSFVSTHIDSAVLCINYHVKAHDFWMSLNMIIEQIERIKKCKEESLAYNKPFFMDNMWFWLEDTRQFNDYLAWNTYFCGSENFTIKQKIESFKNISCDELNKTANTIFRFCNTSVLICGQTNKIDKTELNDFLRNNLK